MPTTGFCKLIGKSEQTWRRYQTRARPARPAEGPWPQLVRGNAKATIVRHTGDHVAWGHHRSWAMTNRNGVQVSVWQLDFSDFETIHGGAWRIAGCNVDPETGFLPGVIPTAGATQEIRELDEWLIAAPWESHSNAIDTLRADLARHIRRF